VVTLLRDSGDGRGLVVRLFNPAETEDGVVVRGPEGMTATVRHASLWGEPGDEALVEGRIVVPPRGIATIRVQY
jgi:hypothetical protein